MNSSVLNLGILYVLGIFVLIYVFTVIPAKRRNQKVRAMHDAVKAGDEIVTVGGVIAEVVSRDGEELILKINSDGTLMKIIIYAVQSIRKSA
ncbi:MAG: preprotein translocase subunit YajC [Synergistaceae bacterium]|nr:preprotein translocase subunit YajC [Synergistaceae bacterium]MBQ3625726.1 preprotein translocase subunit YajC [Synergistaceae bacterium]MBQ7570179.1 preprotein translocase subunit YajC [Synergistaceae bacterium]MBQ9582651.1 preprotein translocase subunit YajC [Synergistaceae bacterium]MBR0096622.1 preprotein translocase subunit YajC [Synergistaceae bacterium]